MLKESESEEESEQSEAKNEDIKDSFSGMLTGFWKHKSKKPTPTTKKQQDNTR